MNRKILILTPCLLVGGTEIHTLMLVRALTSAGFHVCVCAYYEHDAVMVCAIQAAGARVRLMGLRRDAASRNLSRMPALALALGRLLREERPALVHVQYMAPGLIPLLVARLLCAAPLVATVHVPGHQYRWRTWVVRSVAAMFCRVLIGVSETVEKSFFGDSAFFNEDLYREGRRHFTIHNPVDVDEVDGAARFAEQPSLRRARGLAGRRVIALLSRLSPEKGAHDLVAAMPAIGAAAPDVTLLVIGDGPERGTLEESARRLGVHDRVVWTGRLPRPEALRHLALADVVAVPSHFEGFGLSAVEAMAMGKPVVATNVDGLREIITHGETGVLVPPQDPVVLASALLAVLRNPSRGFRLGEAGRSRVTEQFGIAKFAELHARLYFALGVTPPRGRRPIEAAIEAASMPVDIAAPSQPLADDRSYSGRHCLEAYGPR